MNLAFFLEEPSAREMLKGLLPRLLPSGVTFQFVVFDGKRDLQKNLVRKLTGWRRPNTAFLVLQDQDSSDCVALKRRLVGKCEEAGISGTTVRIVCRELESWYFGDLAAVERGLGLADLERYGGRSQYRVPDRIVSPSSELRKITRGGYQKVSGSRAIGPHMSLSSNKSVSFGVFVTAVRQLVGGRRATYGENSHVR